jgi:hypothetical protein
MIHPLRQRHRRAFAVLAVLIPLLFAWGIAARRGIPVMSRDAGADTHVAGGQP